MNWIAPAYLATPWLVVPIALVVAFGGWWHRRRLREIFGDELLARVLPRSVRTRRFLRDVGALLALVLGCIALAEPAFDKEIVKVKTKGVDLVLAVDLSRSMDAQDVDPSRLERARREVVDLLDLLTGDRVGVVFFAGEAYPRLPLTEDYRAVEWVFEEANTSMFSAQGSQLGKALDVSRELLRRDEGKAGKAIIVISDGETHDPEDALRAAREAEADGVLVYLIGVGSEPAPIPLKDGSGGFLSKDGQRVMTNPDFETMTEVARITGGGFVRSLPSAADMEGLYRSAIRSSLTAVERDTQQTEKWKTAYQYPLGAALLLWLAGSWLGEGRRRFGAAAAVLITASVAFSPLGAGVAAASTLEEADALYRKGEYSAAEKALEELSLENPGDSDLYQRLGAARYRNNDWLGAARAFEQASRLRGGDAEAEYNAGNARYRAGQLEEALERYDRALKVDSGHERAAKNKELVSGEIEVRRQQQPPPPPKPQEGDSKDEEGSGEGDSDEQSDSQQEQSGEQEGQSEGSSEGDPEGDPQDNSSEDGEPRQQGESDANPDSQDGSAENPSQREGTDGEPDQGSDATDPDELDGDQGSEEQSQDGVAGDGGDMGEEGGNITPAQASRMLDGVEEGRQRVRITGSTSDKPW